MNHAAIGTHLAGVKKVIAVREPSELVMHLDINDFNLVDLSEF
jgi:hypothetical protein